MGDAMSGKIPWARVAIEGVVIVGSILLAFAIDAWWDGLGQREAERVALAGLEADFSAYVERLAEIRQSNERRIDAAGRLTDASGAGHSSPSDAEFRADLARVVMYSSINLQPGTLGSLIETNQLSWISDAELRSKLVDWNQNQRRAEDQNGYMVEQSRELDVFLKRRYPMDGILRLAQDPDLDVSEAMSRFPVSGSSLLADLEFANHVAFASDASVLVMNRVGILEDLAAEILLLLQANRVGG
jgi:hypothetical protein